MNDEKAEQTSTEELIDSSAPLEGLLLVAASISPNNDDFVQINVIHQGQAWCVMTCDVQKARTWLGEDAQRLVRWDPSFVEDDGLSGIYRKPSFQIPAWIVHWEEICHEKDRTKVAAILGTSLEDEEVE